MKDESKSFPNAELLRQLPSVNELLQHANGLLKIEGHQRTVQALRIALESVRTAIKQGAPLPTAAEIIGQARSALQASLDTRHSPLVNATGVIIHTNLGRAPLSTAAQAAMLAAAQDYSPLEFDMQSGQRGKRGAHVEQLLCEITGAEAALIVNNCAFATVLMLGALAAGKGVLISRGQLVEIGGGFRVPDVMKQSGAILIEVGTTNRVHRRDYEDALEDGRQTTDDGRSTTEDFAGTTVGAILRVHSSNFKIIGFTSEVSLEELVEVAHAQSPQAPRAPLHPLRLAPYVLDDLGSGALYDTAQFGLSHEPTVQESVQAGADVVAFSGDKLLGGPQAGILVGKREAIERCRKHPLARAFRADKFTLAALGATLLHYARGEAQRAVPIVRMMALTKDAIRARAEWMREALGGWALERGLTLGLVDGESTVGGGSLPGETLPTVVLALGNSTDGTFDSRWTGSPFTAESVLVALREVGVIGRIKDGRVLLDLRTVLDDGALVERLLALNITPHHSLGG